MFVFEILFILKFLFAIFLLAVFVRYVWKEAPELFGDKPSNVWKMYLLIVSAAVMFYFTSFFTLTEEANIIKQQQYMMEQSNQIRNDKLLDVYLSENKVKVVDRRAELVVELAKEKEITKNVIKQSFSQGVK